jgi:hypothetical protein
MIYLPVELVSEAGRLGLNISRISHNASTDTITKLNSPNGELAGKDMAGPQGFTAILLLEMDSKFAGFESHRFRTQ